jgi:adenylate kinase
MSRVLQIHDKYFQPYITEAKLHEAVHKLALQVYEDIPGGEIPVFIAILNGSFMFAADFLRAYPGMCEISFVKLSSYEGIQSTGEVNELVGITEDLKDRTVIILEDIIDTGNTLAKIYDIFKSHQVKSLKIATLFFKPDVFTRALPIDYIGLSIPDRFIIGYGLDYNGLGRNLKDIYQLKTTKMKNIVLFGPPGAGKGTQAEKLKDYYDLVHISTGDVFRYNIKNHTELGKLAQSYMDRGDLVPDEVTVNMLKSEVEKHPDAKGFIFDGFPRTLSQAEALDEFLAEKGESISGMVALEVPEDELVKRLLLRGKTSGRADDQDEDKIRNRFREYREKTEVLKSYYDKQGKYYGVNGLGSIEEITGRLKEVMDTL